MSNNSQLNNLGEQIKGALNDALETGNYNELKALVTDTVTSALNEAGATASNAWKRQQESESRKRQEEMNRETESWKRQEEMQREAESRQWQEETKRRREEMRRQRQAREQQEKELRAQQERAFQAQREEKQRQKSILMEQQRFQRTGLVVDVKNNGMPAGVLLIVFGALASIPLFILSLIGLASGWGAAGYLLFFFCLSVFCIIYGKRKIDLISKAKRYVKLCGFKMYAEVEELAAQVGVSSKKVEKELRRILRKGIIPSAHLDKKGTHLMLNEVVYKQYMDAEKARVQREKEQKEQEERERAEAKNKQKMSKTPEEEENAQQKTELQQMVQEGQECIQKLRDMNDMIPGEVISAKLYQLENLLKEIFQRVQKDPSQMNRMHKVMNYYLPTTLKLVEAYHEFDIISNPNEEIISAKKEIEETLDTINEAFVELLNSLFQDKVMDVTTDAQVLQTMLASEGLTKEMDFVRVDKEL